MHRKVVGEREGIRKRDGRGQGSHREE